jgi:hypothetical protein
MWSKRNESHLSWITKPVVHEVLAQILFALTVVNLSKMLNKPTVIHAEVVVQKNGNLQQEGLKKQTRIDARAVLKGSQLKNIFALIARRNPLKNIVKGLVMKSKLPISGNIMNGIVSDYWKGEEPTRTSSLSIRSGRLPIVQSRLEFSLGNHAKYVAPSRRLKPIMTTILSHWTFGGCVNFIMTSIMEIESLFNSPKELRGFSMTPAFLTR